MKQEAKAKFSETGVGMSPHRIGRKTRKISAVNQWKLEKISTQSHQKEPVFVETSNSKLMCQLLDIDAHTLHVMNTEFPSMNIG